jgi:hypothetical protein
MKLVIDTADLPLYIGGALAAAIVFWSLYTIADWFLECRRRVKQFEADRAQLFKQAQDENAELRNQNDVLREQVQKHILDSLSWIDERKRLIARCAQLANELRTDDIMSKKTIVITPEPGKDRWK